MTNRPRTPRHYPRMKVRGQRRRQQAPLYRMAGSLDRFGLECDLAAWQLSVLAAAFRKRPQHLGRPKGERILTR